MQGEIEYRPIQGGVEILPVTSCYRNSILAKWPLRQVLVSSLLPNIQFPGTHLCIWVERGTVKVENIVSFQAKTDKASLKL